MASTVSCARCQESFDVDDTNALAPCPRCEHVGATVERCAACPLDAIDHMRQFSRAGRLLDRVLQLEFASERFRIDWDAVTIEESRCLQILIGEREAYRAEMAERDRQNRRGGD